MSDSKLLFKDNPIYQTTLEQSSHWSLIVRRGMQMTLTDVIGGANVGMLFFNPTQLSEKYNAPDTLKAQHTFKLTKGHCLFSDMGRIFCAITEDSFGWHESICGNSHAEHIEKKWGQRDYQNERNCWKQNGYDAFLVELAKYKLKRQDMASNLNLFSAVHADDDSKLSLNEKSKAGDLVTLRFEMDTLVVLHNCPHPLSDAAEYPMTPIDIKLEKAPVMLADDLCLNLCPENKRGYENNALYHLGL